MNTKNERLNLILDKAKTLFNNVGKVTIILAALVVGFITGELYHRANQKPEDKLGMDPEFVYKIKDTDISFNQRNELLIIDRKTKTGIFYEGAVGREIFRQYASRMTLGATK